MAFYEDIVKDQKIAQVVLASAFAQEDDGLLAAGAVLMPTGDRQKVLQVMRGRIERVKTEGVTERELEKAKNQYLRDEVTQSLTAAGKASLFGECETLEGGAEKANTRLEEIRAITADDIRRVANLYLVKNRETGGIVEPQIGFSKKDEADEGAAPVERPEVNRVAERGGCCADLKYPDWYPEGPPIAPLKAGVY
ncbi:MAG: insulinase family protein [Phycisphaerales bacterium]|nr:MAG: insulinase family protein [Phycisphaerales bacterium]